ncbi:MAG: type IV pilus assembly protein PilM [Armatimonadota bacterium]|nr:type IV pilus assembly protein PilM [bacterium]
MSPSRKSSPSAVVGLDLGTDSIKVAEAKVAKDGITITGLGVARMPEGIIENEVIVDPKALGSAIKALLAESGIKTKTCVSSVTGQSRVVVRVIEVPNMSGKELAETMRWEVERHVPFPPNEVVMDFQPLEKPNADPNAQNMEVLLAVAQQELIDSHVQSLKAAGLKPMAIDIEPLAASRSLIELTKNPAQPDDEVVAIVNIGANNTDLGIFENGLLTFPSPPLGIAGISFTREIAEAMGQTLDQAELTKKEYAAVDLNAFPAAPEPTDQVTSGFSAEPASFDTAVGPQDTLAGFDLGGDVPASTDAAPATGFQDTVDGPVFGGDDPLAGFNFATPEPAAPAPQSPAFDLGGDAPAAAPAFDLGGDTPAAAPAFDLNADAAPIGPVFDFGAGTDSSDDAFNIGGDVSSQPVTPSFDLDDDEPAPAQGESSSPSFDLSDTNQWADPGEQASAPVPTASPVQAGSVEDRVFQAISGVLTDLATEIRRSLDYYGTKYGKNVQRIYLCGGTAKMPKLDVYLSRELGVPVQVANPLGNLKMQVPAASPQYVNEVSPLFSVSIGLAIRDMIG